MLIKALKSIFRIIILFVICLGSIFVLVARPLFVEQVSTTISPSINVEDLERHVVYLSQKSVSRSADYPENLEKVANYISRELSLSSNDVSLQKFSVDSKEYANVIATFGPDSSEVIIIGAHYDAYSELPGADDNASGVSGMIELAKLLATLDLNLQVQLVAYTLEEPPFFASKNMGSYIHAASIKDQNVKIMISLEMIGYFSDEMNSQTYPMKLMDIFYPNQGNFIAIVDSLTTNNAVDLKAAINKYTDLPAYSINAPKAVTGVDFSDHRNYWSFGFPAIMITDTSFYRNKAYHTAEDTYDRLNYDSMAKVVFGLFMYIKELNEETS